MANKKDCNAHCSSRLEHYASINVDKPPHAIKKTGIICTIGPASRKPEILQQMVKAGMTIARLNFSHGTHEYHAESVRTVREVAATFPGLHLAIALDTKGPEVRTGTVDGDETREIQLKTGGMVTVTTNDEFKDRCSPEMIYLDYKNFSKVAKPGQKIFVDDGLLNLAVKEIDGENLKCEVVCGGSLCGKKGVNLPGIDIDLPPVSEQDRGDLQFAVKHNLDMVFASFIRNASNVKAIRDVLGDDGKYIQIVSKVENHQGLKNIDEIIEASDGVMVARGDLGVQIPQEKLTLAQKLMIAKCNKVGKPVICATQMLESMTQKPRPTRAEIADVTNAVLDGADCVMLSGESAKGQYPIDAVRIMGQICQEAEKVFHQTRFSREIKKTLPTPTPPTHATAISAVEISLNTGSTAIIVLSTTGQAARMVSKYRPQCPIIAMLGDAKVARTLQLCRGVIPVTVIDDNSDWVADADRRVQIGMKTGIKMGFVKPGDPVIVVTGWKQGQGYSNTLRVIAVPPENALSAANTQL